MVSRHTTLSVNVKRKKGKKETTIDSKLYKYLNKQLKEKRAEPLFLKYITSKPSLTVYSFQKILGQPYMREQEGSLRNGHKKAEFAGKEEKLDSSDRNNKSNDKTCLLYTSPSPRDQRGSRMPSSA